MKITIPTAPLANALKFIRPYAVGPAYAQAVWLVIHSGSLSLEFYNAHNDVPAFRFPLAEDVTGESDRVVGVNARLLARMLHGAPSSIVLSIPRADGISTTRIGILYPGAVLSLGVVPPEWQQEFPSVGNSARAEVSPSDLAHVLRAVYQSSNSDTGVDILNCVHVRVVTQKQSLLGGLFAEAMNGHQYQSCSVEDSLSGWDAILPESGVFIRRQLVHKLLPFLRRGALGEHTTAVVEPGDAFSLFDKPARLHLSGTGGTVVIPLYVQKQPYLDTEYFREKARKGKNSIVTNAGDLRRALATVNAFDHDALRAVSLLPGYGILEVYKKCNGIFDEAEARLKIPAECAGHPATPVPRIDFPSASLLALLRPFGADETVTLRITNADGPCLITGDKHPHEETVVMPMKIVDEEW